MKHLLRYLKKYRKESFLGPLFKLLEATFDLCVPLVVASIIDRGIFGEGGPDMAHVLRCCGILVGLALVGLLAAVTAQWFAAKAAVGVATSLRQALFDKTQALSFAGIDKQGTSTLLTRMTSDVNQVQSGVNLFLRLFLRSPFIVLGAMVMAFVLDKETAWIFLGVILLLSLVVFGIMLITMPLYRRVQKRLDGVTAATRETLSGVRVLRAFCREEEEKEEFARRNNALSKAQLFVGRISALMNPATYVLVNAGVILLLYTGGIRVDRGEVTTGEVVALYNYLSQILVELVKLANLIITLTRSVACMHRVGAVLELAPEASVGRTPTEEEQADAPRIRFSDVSLRYPGAGDETLSHIDLSVYPGETVGIIGGTGSGKSSLVHLVPRFYDITGGELVVDGLSVSQWDPTLLRKRIGIVMQKAEIFSGTVRENLLYGNEEAEDEALWEALSAAQLAETVKEKGGLSARIEQKGRNLSGGQRQRLSVARALVRRPEILILDDASSALDYATDAKMRKAIAALPYHPTVLIVSQRTASLSKADKILVLDDGEAVGLGTHEELLSSCQVYREIYESQYGKEEIHGKE